MPASTDQQQLGNALVADYQSVMVALATIEAAKYEAVQSENELVNQLTAMSGGYYLNPNSFNTETQTNVTRASLDAHFKKVQANQLEAMNAVQLQQLIAQDRSSYIGRKVQVLAKDKHNQAVESIWLDQRTSYRKGIVRRVQTYGIIEEVLLDRNVLILRPTLRTRILNQGLQNYLVYIIDPASFQPLVDLAIV